MSNFSRFKNRLLAKALTRFPILARMMAAKVKPLEFDTIPWAPLRGPLKEMKVALITTAGVHLVDDKPFDMNDKTGDPTFRVVPSSTPAENLAITHDYYNHKDADTDINIVFPIHRLAEFASEGRIGAVAERHFGFMGHIEENHLDQFINEQIPAVTAMLKEDGVDVVLITPG